jgi:hypothetical protein
MIYSSLDLLSYLCDIEIVINLNEDNHDDVLNAPISQDEIENVILSLHNDKSSGLDNK